MPQLRESRRLFWLGQQLDQVETAFAAALKRKALGAGTEPSAEITWFAD
ncbi:hypothetical protein [Bradyrhizobium japonicum]